MGFVKLAFGARLVATLKKESLSAADWPKVDDEVLANYAGPADDKIEDRPAMPASHADWHRNCHRQIWMVTRFIGAEWLPAMASALDHLYEWSEMHPAVFPPSAARDA